MQRNLKKKNNVNIDGKKMKLALVVSTFNSDITEKLLDGSLKELKNNGVLEKNIEIVHVPGGFEIPLACQRLAMKKKFNGIIAIGCVIRGDTDHYLYIANEATRGVMDVMLKYNIPIANAILTVNNLEQAKNRAAGEQNKGIEAAKAMLEFLSIK